MINAAIWLWGFLTGAAIGTVAFCYLIAQTVGPKRTPSGELANRWQKLGYLTEKLFDAIERGGK